VKDDQVSWPDPSRTARSALMSPDKRQVVSFGKSNELRVWDVEKKKLLHTLAGHAGGVADAAITSDGRILTVGADKALRVWDAATGIEVEGIDLPEPASCVRLSPDGHSAVTASAGGPDAAMQLWRLSK
jgi:WD40 repeat protein